MTVTIELSKNPKSVKGIIYKSRFLQKKKQKTKNRCRISKTTNNQKEPITGTKVERKRTKQNLFSFNI